MKKCLALIAVLVGLSGVAKAGVMIEPYVGYANLAADGGDMTGVLYGARLAYTLPALFWFGLDATMGSVDYKPSSGGSNTEYDVSTYSVVAGVNFPILLRAWVAKSIQSKYKSTSAEITTSMTKVGLGYKLIPMLSLNLEYIIDDPQKLKTGGSEVNSTSDNTTGFLLSLSVPF